MNKYDRWSHHCSARGGAEVMLPHTQTRCEGCGLEFPPPTGYTRVPGYEPHIPSALDTQVAGSHYKDMVIQPVEFITRNKIGFLPGCVIKRVCRYKGKAGAEDLRKAIHELQLMLELEYPGEAK